MVYKFFDKKSSGSGITNESNYQLANELHKNKYKNSFARGYVSNWPEEVFIVNKIKNTVP